MKNSTFYILHFTFYTFPVSYFFVFDVLTYLTVTGQVLFALLATSLGLSFFGSGFGLKVRNWVSHHGILLMLIVAVIATSGSLFFSEIALFAPCKDCWIQRIFMYPQVVLLGIALWRKDRNVAWYILAMCLLGGAMSAEHYIEQWEAILDPVANDPMEPCDLSGVSCSATYIFELGYITIPMMAGTAFALNLLGSVSMLLTKKR